MNARPLIEPTARGPSLLAIRNIDEQQVSLSEQFVEEIAEIGFLRQNASAVFGTLL